MRRVDWLLITRPVVTGLMLGVLISAVLSRLPELFALGLVLLLCLTCMGWIIYSYRQLDKSIPRATDLQYEKVWECVNCKTRHFVKPPACRRCFKTVFKERSYEDLLRDF